MSTPPDVDGSATATRTVTEGRPVALDENPTASSSGQIADHAALKAEYDARRAGPALPRLGPGSTEAEHRAVHALLHAEHNRLGVGPRLPTVITGGQGEHLAHHRVLHQAYNARQRLRGRPAYRGVNLSGAEFTADAEHLPGVVDRDYRYPTAGDLRYVADRGHRMVRLPIRWERVQPTLMGRLQPAEVQRILSTLDRAAAYGLQVLVDLHNYARYTRPAREGGATLVLGDGRLTDVHLADLWSRLSAVLKGRAGVLGYGLMNEPHDLPGAAAAPTSGAAVWSFEDGAGSWSGEADAVATTSTAPGTVREGRASLRVRRRMPVGRDCLRVNDNAQNRLDPSAGRTLSAWVMVPRGAPGRAWSAQLEMQDAAYRWRAGGSTALTPGEWARVSCTPDDATWSGHRGVAVQFSCEQGAPVTADAYVDTIRQHDADVARLSEARQWERAAQRCVDAIRANQDRTPVYVPGVGFSGAQSWPDNHPAPWIQDAADAVVYEAHYYCDRDNSGTFARSFSDEDADARRRGHGSLEVRATAELGRFLDWCGRHGVQGFLGEVGWDGSRDAERWNAVGDALYAAADTAGVGAAYWAAGQWYGSSYNLSVYTGAPLSRRAAPATVVEAHPSLNV